MKALIDTCVIIDYLQKREPFNEDALKLMQMSATNSFDGFITAKSATDVFYLNHKFTHSDRESRGKLSSILEIIGLLDTSADDIFRAIMSVTHDFEDAVMIETALRSGMDCIITRNTNDFKGSSIKVLTPADFIKTIETEDLED